MKFVPTTKFNVYKKYIVKIQITSVCVQELNISNTATTAKQSHNNLYFSKTTNKETQVIFKRNRQNQNLSKKNSIFKNWKNQNFCIATS